MVKEIFSWEQFVLCGGDDCDIPLRFESLCRQLFANEFLSQDSYRKFLQTIPNNPGIEAEPIYIEHEESWVGFQAKYFTK